MHMNKIAAVIVSASLVLLSNANSTQIIGTATTVKDRSVQHQELIKIEKISFIPEVKAKTKTVKKKKTKAKKKSSKKVFYSAKYFKRRGVLRYNGWKWKYYSQKVLPGKGLKIPGRHVDKNGYVCDKNNYICVASSVLKKGTVIKSPLGKKAKVYDCGCAKDTIDTYVNW